MGVSASLRTVCACGLKHICQVITTFMLGVPKRDIDASFKADRFTVSWHTVHETERVEGRMVYREREEKHHSRTIQVPEKTKVRFIHKG